MATPDDAEFPPGKSATPSINVSQFVTTASERFLAASGVCLIIVAVASFGAVIFREFRHIAAPHWQDLLAEEASTFVLLLVGVVCALLGLRLLTTTQHALARTIPKEDLPMIQAAVIAGKPAPIDQYVRLRSLAGWAGTFTKLGVTGLPLVTVALTLIFSFIALLPLERAKDFLDLAKLTLGAFIGSFVQRSVELKKQDAGSRSAAPSAPTPSLPV
ncbi:MAG: hypothetical protein ABSG16_24595 [Candidatus Acidiferrum sp.]